MLDIFSGLRLVVKRRNISIDNAIFRCHWFFTSTLLVSFSLIITARQYVGQPIECHSVNKIPDSLLNSYCWVQSTFTVPQACNNQQVGFEVPYPCIDNTRGREIKMFAYYQWVGIVLFIQGLLFHLPYYLWKVWENGLIKAITGGLRIAVLSDQERVKKRDIVVDYIHDHLGCHKRYALKYFVCEFICLLNLLGQLWATNKFFDGQFLRYGIDVMHYSSSSISSQLGISSSSTQQSVATSSKLQATNTSQQHIASIPSNSIAGGNSGARSVPRSVNQVDPMTYIFPRMTKCTYYDFGSSGDVQKHDALCLLPLNIINEKIYIALWFWFLILAILTLLVIIYRLFAIVSESVRCKGLISRCKLSNEHDIRVICKHCDVGDWFLFYMVAENLDPLIMREIVTSVADKIRAHLQLKKALGVGEHRQSLSSDVDHDYLYKLKLVAGDQTNAGYRAMSFDDDSLTAASTRRNSIVTEEMPLVKKLKKRFYSKRLWSIDLGTPEMRQQLAGLQQHHQSASNTESGLASQSGDASTGFYQQHGADSQTTNGSVVVSAPPISQMPLNSVPLLNHRRRGSLSRMASTSSNSSTATADSFIMEMQTISGSSSQIDDLNRTEAKSIESQSFERRPSFQNRQALLRHRRSSTATTCASVNSHQHHQSMSSIRELRPANVTNDLL